MMMLILMHSCYLYMYCLEENVVNIPCDAVDMLGDMISYK